MRAARLPEGEGQWAEMGRHYSGEEGAEPAPPTAAWCSDTQSGTCLHLRLPLP